MTVELDRSKFQELLAAGRLEAAEALANGLLARDADDAMALSALGVITYRRNEFRRAAEAFRRASELVPSAAVFANLGAALRAGGDLPGAEAAYRAALRLEPGYAQALANYANLLGDLGQHAESEAMARRALAAGASGSEIQVTLGNALFRLGRLPEAAEVFKTALAHEYSGTAARNLGSTLANLGRFDEAEAVYRRSLAAAPGQAAVHSSLLICVNYNPDHSAERILAEHKAYAADHAAPFYPAAPRFENDRDPERPLRIGYVSPDLCAHVVSLFMLPIIKAHDPARVAITCYAEVRNIDDTSRAYQALGDWVQTTGLSDDAIAARIRADKIDVLIDLAGHSPGNRLQVFARRPAPVQLGYVIGTGTTTGLAVLDGLIADDALLPQGADAIVSEPPLRLPRPFVAYAPPAAMPEVGPLPVLTRGHITFGYFGRPIRLNARVLRLWAEILHAVPGSRLRLDNAPFGEASVRADLEARFAGLGIGAERLDLRYTTPQSKTWAGYNEIDIALDPFPQNAGTTTLEALYMGVPVVSIADRPPVGRLGVALLGAVGLADWVAVSEADYLRRAVAAARDVAGLAALRAGLRARFKASQLADIPGLTRALEDAYRAAWRRWCRSQNGPFDRNML